MDITKISIEAAVFLLMLLCIKMYLDYYNRTNKNGNSYTVRPEEEKPIIVTEDYLYKQSGLTKNEYEQRMALYRKSRTKKIEEDLETEVKKDLKKESSIDDELGMSF